MKTKDKEEILSSCAVESNTDVSMENTEALDGAPGCGITP
jgi:hypothetical protein